MALGPPRKSGTMFGPQKCRTFFNNMQLFPNKSQNPSDRKLALFVFGGCSASFLRQVGFSSGPLAPGRPSWPRRGVLCAEQSAARGTFRVPGCSAKIVGVKLYWAKRVWYQLASLPWTKQDGRIDANPRLGLEVEQAGDVGCLLLLG